MTDGGIRRVLMTTDTVGGVWTFTLELAGALAKRGIDVVLAALGGHPSADQRDAASSIPGLCLLGSDFRLEWMEEPWHDVEASRRWLAQLALEYTPDLVHLNSFGAGGAEWNAPVVLTAHSCVVSWWKAVHGNEPPARWDRYRSEVARSLSAADVITAPSQAMAKTLSDNYGLAGGCAKIRTIYNGIGGNSFSKAKKEPLIFSAGRLWDDAKNARSLAQIARELTWPVYLAGESDGAIEDCTLLGKLSRNEMSGWYARASIYALPARYEPFGLSALEAAYSGCALVLGDIPSLREIWGDAALLVDPESPEELRDALNQLVDNQPLRIEMATRSHARALQFSAERMAGQYLDLYRSMAAKRKTQCVS